MYKLCVGLFIVSTVCIFINMTLIFRDMQDTNHYARACTFIILSASSFYLMKYYKSRRK
ncbi:hypothetical protein CLV62_10150 [Dysgonomonas alginatilytica]|uniref:Uncharacterized protein n=1 Tax=Dysgonomonas alginatilytica TaxID=1605892 RepID=A0A2V3PST7_9BACT|nr:hypothetical protein CLV62_10150 [Dysgonomonas alginatilytica]